MEVTRQDLVERLSTEEDDALLHLLHSVGLEKGQEVLFFKDSLVL